MPFRPLRRHDVAMSFQILLLGVTVGLVAVLPPGPVSISLIEVGVQQGRVGGVRGALGIAGGDILVASLAAGVVLLGGSLPESVFDAARLLSSVVLIGLGLAFIVQPAVTQGFARSIRHPARTFFWLTALTPTVFGAWLVLIAAMPFSDQPGPVIAFVIGGMVASLTYHLLLGSAAGGVGKRLPEASLQRLSRLGGCLMIVFALWTLS